MLQTSSATLPGRVCTTACLLICFRNADRIYVDNQILHLSVTLQSHLVRDGFQRRQQGARVDRLVAEVLQDDGRLVLQRTGFLEVICRHEQSRLCCCHVADIMGVCLIWEVLCECRPLLGLDLSKSSALSLIASMQVSPIQRSLSARRNCTPSHWPHSHSHPRSPMPASCQL